MSDLITLKAANAKRWSSARLTRDFSGVARRLVAAPAKDRYQVVERTTGVPWFVIAVIHQREASQRWDTQLGQGNPLNQKSTHVPKDRGPFPTWENGAEDALVECAPHAARWADWTIGGALTLLEQYNGLGYFVRDLPSPYIWSGTDQYHSGKFVADGKFDPNAVDQQLGCAGLLMEMAALDSSIVFAGSPIKPVQDVKPKPVPAPIPTQPTPKPTDIWSVLASIFNAVLNIFRRK